MATAGYGRAPYESEGDREKFHKRLLRPEIYEEPQNVSQEAGQIDSTEVAYEDGNSADTLILELELMLKKKTFARSETQHLMAVLRTFEESQSPVIRLEALTKRGSLKKHKQGDDSDIFHADIVSSRVPAEEMASPAYAYGDRTTVTSQAPRQDSKFSNNDATCLPKTPMASPQHPTTIDSLPDELLVNIFIRLFAKQLAQMRSVSKSWNALLSHPSFIKSHLHRSIHTNDRIHLHFFNESSFGFKSFTAHPCPSAHLQRTNSIKLPAVNSQSKYKSIRVIGSVNGLICSSYSDTVIHIWNPSLSAVLTLPPYSMPSVGYDPLLIYFRFGFDPKTDDYKVVKLTGLIKQEYISVIEWWLDVEIYSMRKGAWELITERFPSHIRLINDDDQICVDGHDGHLHWHGYTGEDNDTKTIVAFDLSSQTFHEIPFPDATLDDNVDDRVDYLGVLSGKLCVMSWVGDGTCEVWVMEEYGVVESWVKRHVFLQFSGDTYPFGFTSHNEFLIEDIYDRLVFYDPIANKSKILENYRLKEYGGDAGKFVEYVDSLVWVAPAEPKMMDGAGQN